MFTRKEFVRFNDAIVELHAATDLATLAQRSVHLLRLLVDGDFHALSICESRFSHSVAVWEPQTVPLEKFGDLFATIQHHHPLYVGWKRVGSTEKPMRITDCVQGEHWRENPIYRDVFRPLGFRNQLGVWSEIGPGHHLEIGSMRAGRDYRQRDRERFDLARPHITQAYMNWWRSAQLRSLPPAPQLLLQQCRLASARLQVADGWSSDRKVGHSVPADRISRADKLTPRELEIATWIAQGKSNAEVSSLIGGRPRTTEKHVEHILAKLKVTGRHSIGVRLRELGFQV